MSDTEKENASTNPSGSKRWVWGLLAICVVVVLAIVAFRPKGNPNGGVTDANLTAAANDRLQSHLTQLRSALAATENLESADAVKLWDSLQADFPDDPSIALNRVLNSVLVVDSLSGIVISPLSEQAEKDAARQQVSPAITAAREAIDDYEKLSQDKVTGLWLRSRIDLHAAALVPALGKSMRRDVFAKLSASVDVESTAQNSSVILGGPLTRVLDELEDPIDGLPTQLLSQANAAVGTLSEQHPGNLFLAIRAASLAIESKDKNAAVFVSRTLGLAKAIEPSLNETTKSIGLTPQQLVGQITSAIEDTDWDTASNRMLQWFNVLNPTEILKTDRRRASPHPLDRLSFQTLRRLSAQAITQSPLGQGESPLSFAAVTVDAAKNVVAALPIDFDLDLQDDIATINSAGKLQLWQNTENQWEAAGEVLLKSKATGLIVADLFMVDSSNPQRVKSDGATGSTKDRDYSSENTHDTFPSLIAFGGETIELVSIDGRSTTDPTERMSVIEKSSGLENVTGVVDVVTGDLEGDGDLDLAVATKADGVRLFVNRGNRTFFEVTHHDGGFDPSDPATSMVVADIDRDLDLDIVTVHPQSGRVGILENQLHLQFRGRLLDDVPVVKDASAIAVAEVDGNVSWDIVVGGSDEVAIVFSQTADAGIWTVEDVQTRQMAAAQFALADLDNDSWSETIVPGSTVRIGPWGISEPITMDFLPQTDAMAWPADLDGDGRLDLVSVADQKLVVATNETTTKNHHLTVRFKGIADNNASSGRVNHFGIGSVLELRFGPHYRSHIIESPATHFGLDGYDNASSIRVIMPNGLTQTIRQPKVDALVQEKQTLKGSCPYLYAWDGEKYAFVTDCLWAAPLGLQVARGVVAKDRPWEYLKVAGDAIRPVDGRYRLRFTEELWEVAYFDHLALTAVDHPKGVDIWTNEKVGPPSIAGQTIFAFGENDRHALASAVDTNGRDVTDLLARRDRQFVKAFDRRLRQGLCPPHWIDLDFDAAEFSKTGDEAVYLVLTGWILPTDTSLNIQIDQNPDLPAIEFPSVWVPDEKEESGWRKAIPFMGFPGGKTKTIVVDVTDVIAKADPRLRVRTSAQIYWDDATLVVQSDRPRIVTQELAMLNAEVAYHGFSRQIKPSETEPEVYDYQQAATPPKWPPLRGTLTKFGPCKDLLTKWDDSMVVISSGDEIQVDFAVPTNPIPDGWERDFVLHCVGWDKDADLNTLAGQTIGPLPFRKMAMYPPMVDALPQATDTIRANSSHRSRRQSFRSFWYRPDSRPDASPGHRSAVGESSVGGGALSQFRVDSFDEIRFAPR